VAPSWSTETSTTILKLKPNVGSRPPKGYQRKKTKKCHDASGDDVVIDDMKERAEVETSPGDREDT